MSEYCQITTPRKFLECLYEDMILADVTFEVGEDLTEFMAHRCILATRSPVFKAMFLGGMRESEKSTTVIIEDITADAFSPILKYIYTGYMDNLTTENVVDVLYAAEKYLLGDIVYKCNFFLEYNGLSASTVCLVFANVFGRFDEAQKICLEYIVKNAQNVFQRPENVTSLSDRCWEVVLSSNLPIDNEMLVSLSAHILWPSPKRLTRGNIFFHFQSAMNEYL
eukprot:933688_1